MRFVEIGPFLSRRFDETEDDAWELYLDNLEGLEIKEYHEGMAKVGTESDEMGSASGAYIASGHTMT